MTAELTRHIQGVVEALKQGRVVPFLGAGANLCDRPDDARWEPRGRILPLGGELAKHLARRFSYPESKNDPGNDLSRVSQYASVIEGSIPLYDELRDVFEQDFPLTTLHRLLAALPGRLAAKGYPTRSDDDQQRFVAVTTNYDDLLERAFEKEGQPCHLVWYLAEGKNQGSFFHRPPGGESRRVEVPNEYQGMVRDKRPIVLKLHGTIDRQSKNPRVVITEDDYVELLARPIGINMLPAPLPELLKKRTLLFLGYSLKDWNLRVLVNRILEEQEGGWKFSAIQLDAEKADCEVWHHRGVNILDLPLADYAKALAAAVEAVPKAEGAR